MKTVEIQATGKRTTREITRKILSEELEVHSRDLRPIFSVSQVATIMPRGKGIVVNLGVIKMCVLTNKVIVFNLDESEIAEKFIPNLIDKLKAEKPSTDFEAFMLDFAFNHKVKKMRSVLEALEKAVEKMLKKIQRFADDNSLEKLLALKKRISKFEIIVKENDAAALEILEDDEELADLCLSQKKAKTKNINFDEIESILDSFTDQIEQIDYKLSNLKENIDDTQEIITLKLHHRRNTIIRFDLIATLVTALFSFLAVITGLYGMNIRNNLESNHEAFWGIVMIFGILVLIFLGWTWWYLRRNKIL